jgi:hypothetical protein
LLVKYMFPLSAVQMFWKYTGHGPNIIKFSSIRNMWAAEQANALCKSYKANYSTFCTTWIQTPGKTIQTSNMLLL